MLKKNSWRHRLTAAFLAASVVFTAIPAEVFAEEETASPAVTESETQTEIEMRDQADAEPEEETRQAGAQEPDSEKEEPPAAGEGANSKEETQKPDAGSAENAGNEEPETLEETPETKSLVLDNRWQMEEDVPQLVVTVEGAGFSDAGGTVEALDNEELERIADLLEMDAGEIKLGFDLTLFHADGSEFFTDDDLSISVAPLLLEEKEYQLLFADEKEETAIKLEAEFIQDEEQDYLTMNFSADCLGVFVLKDAESETETSSEAEESSEKGSPSEEGNPSETETSGKEEPGETDGEEIPETNDEDVMPDAEDEPETNSDMQQEQRPSDEAESEETESETQTEKEPFELVLDSGGDGPLLTLLSDTQLTEEEVSFSLLNADEYQSLLSPSMDPELVFEFSFAKEGEPFNGDLEAKISPLSAEILEYDLLSVWQDGIWQCVPVAFEYEKDAVTARFPLNGSGIYAFWKELPSETNGSEPEEEAAFDLSLSADGKEIALTSDVPLNGAEGIFALLNPADCESLLSSHMNPYLAFQLNVSKDGKAFEGELCAKLSPLDAKALEYDSLSLYQDGIWENIPVSFEYADESVTAEFPVIGSGLFVFWKDSDETETEVSLEEKTETETEEEENPDEDTLVWIEDSVKISASGKAGTFPEGSSLEVSFSDAADAIGAAESLAEADGRKLLSLYALKLSFYDAEGKVFLPSGRIKISLSGLQMPRGTEAIQVCRTAGETSDFAVISRKDLPVVKASADEKDTDPLSGEPEAVSFTANPSSPYIVAAVGQETDENEADILFKDALTDKPLIPGEEYDLESSISANPSRYEIGGNSYQVKMRIKSVLVKTVKEDGTVSEEPAKTSSGQDQAYVLVPEENHTYTVAAEAYIDAGILGTRILGQNEVQLTASLETGELLPENSDEAYIEGDGIVSMVTGTEPFDADDTAGNDSSADNGTVRTYDIVEYEAAFYTRMQEDAPVSAYKKGRIYYELLIPGTAEQIRFETARMGWLDSKESSFYGKDGTKAVETMEKDGQTYQVLRGSFLLDPTKDNPNAVGNSYYGLEIALRVLRMKNAQTIVPMFTFWLEGNDVGAEYKTIEGQSAYGQSVKVPTGKLVTGNGHVCAKHQTAHEKGEAASFTADPVTVSASARYNLCVVAGEGTRNTRVGSFDFSTGNDLALNKAAPGSPAVYGRIGAFGFSLELNGKDAAQGLRGLELPDDGSTAEFDIDISSVYTAAGKSHANTGEEPIREPLWWSGDNNMNSTPKQDGRAVTSGCSFVLGIPYDKGTAGHGCQNGAKWMFQKQEGKLHVTVSGIRLNTANPSSTAIFPHCASASGNAANDFTYYDKSMTDYWQVRRGIITTGQIWFVQPYKADDSAGSTYEQLYGNGTYSVSLKAENLKIQPSDAGGNYFFGPGTAFSESSLKAEGDNTASQTLPLVRNSTPGSSIYYMKYPTTRYYDYLTDGEGSSGKDWVFPGTMIEIQDYFDHSGAERQYTGAAYDLLIKFDDEFFDPEALHSAVLNNQTVTCLWGAKPDKSGWTDDEEMKNAVSDDLIFFSSTQDLKNEGYVAVAALLERRGLVYEGDMNHLHSFISGTVKNPGEGGVKLNQAYMITLSEVAWNKEGTAEKVLAYYNAKHEEQKSSADELTDADYNDYLKNGFPSRADKKTPMKYTDEFDYPTPFWRKEASNTPGLKDYVKSSVDPDTHEWIGGTAGNAYADSCYVLGHTANLTAGTAQKDPNGTGEKTVYDVTTNQRTADYVISPFLTSAGTASGSEEEIIPEVTVDISLPTDRSLTYMESSMVYGGEYVYNPETFKGSVNGGMVLTANEKTNADAAVAGDLFESYLFTTKTGEITAKDGARTQGVTGLTVTFYNVKHVMNGEKVNFLPLHFSCTIGVSGDDKKDVENSQVIEVRAETASIRDHRTKSQTNQNTVTVPIRISKDSVLSLSAAADSVAADPGDDLGFTMTVGNDTAHTAENYYIIEEMPFNGDSSGSAYTGDLLLKEFSFGAEGDDPSAADAKAQEMKGGLQFYYTTDEKYRDRKSFSYMDSDGNGTADAEEGKEGFSFDAPDWTLIEFEAKETAANASEKSFQYAASNLPETGVVSIAAHGSLPGESALKMHITFALPNGRTGDQLADSLSLNVMEANAVCFLVNRQISGRTWEDSNGNGLQDAEEKPLQNVRVSLMKWNGTGDKKDPANYAALGTMLTGQSMDVSSGEVTEGFNAQGGYRFTCVPSGTFGVLFTDDQTEGITETAGALDLVRFAGAVTDAGGNADTSDSDAYPVYAAKDEGNFITGDLVSSFIPEIILPPKEELTEKTYASANHDAGFVLKETAGKINGSKTVVDHAPQAFSFGIYADENCTVPVFTARPADTDAKTAAYWKAPTGTVSKQKTESSPDTEAFSFDLDFTADDLYQKGSGSYAKEKTFVFYVKEEPDDGSHKGFVFDSSVYRVSFTVSRANADGTLSSTGPVIEKVGAPKEEGLTKTAFTNVYTAEGSASLPVVKTVSGGPMKDGFRFGIYTDPECLKPASDGWSEDNPQPDLESAFVTALTSGDANLKSASGSAEFSFRYTLEDIDGLASENRTAVRTYYVKELDLSEGMDGYTSDHTVYTVKVTITDNGDGNLAVVPKITEKNGSAAEGLAELKFVNSFQATGNASFEGKADVEGGRLKPFPFALYADESCSQKLAESESSAETGIVNVSFPFKDGKTYAYDMSDMLDAAGSKYLTEKKFTYYLKEGDPGAGYTASGEKYRIEVTLRLQEDGSGGMELAPEMHFFLFSKDQWTEKDALTFHHLYHAEASADVTVRTVLSCGKLKAGAFTCTLSACAKGGPEHVQEFYQPVTLLNSEGKPELPAESTDVFREGMGHAFSYSMGDLKDTGARGEAYFVSKEFWYLAESSANGEAKGITADKTRYIIVVTVSDEKQNGVLEVSKVVYTYNEDPLQSPLGDPVTFTGCDLEFHPSYQAAGDFSFNAQKLLSARPEGASESFEFVIREAETDGSGEPALTEEGTPVYKSGKEIRTALNTSGKEGTDFPLSFHADDYFVLNGGTDDTGKHVFLIEEAKDRQEPGIQYANQLYCVDMSVTDQEDGNLSAKTNGIYDLTAADGEKPNFKSKEKQVTGDADKNSVLFTNTYLSRGEAAIQADKTLTGHRAAGIRDGEFTFLAALGSGEGTGDDPLSVSYSEETVEFGADPADTMDENGAYHTSAKHTFSYTQDDLNADGTGVYWYRLTEKESQDSAVTADTSVFYAKVSMKAVHEPNGEGSGADGTYRMETSVAYFDSTGEKLPDGAFPAFTNAYHAAGNFTPKAKKKLTGNRSEQLKEGEFSFEIVQTDESGNILKEEDGEGDIIVCSGINLADGTIQFGKFDPHPEDPSLDSFTEADVREEPYCYLIREIEKNDESIVPVTKEIPFKISVRDDNGSGNLTVSQVSPKAEKMVFENHYHAQGSPVIEAGVVLKGNRAKPIGDGEFTFQASLVSGSGEDSGGDDTQTDGKYDSKAESAVFAPLSFDESDIGRTYVYELTEDSGADQAIMYSSDRYYARIKAEDGDSNGHLSIDVDYFFDQECTRPAKQSEVVFTNQYFADGSVRLETSKVLTGRKLGPEFTFTLSEITDGKEGEPLLSALNGTEGKSAGNVLFDEIAYTQEDQGVHTYRIRETANGIPGVTYDEGYIETSLKVSDNSDGTLRIEVLDADKNPVYEDAAKKTVKTARSSSDLVYTYYTGEGERLPERGNVFTNSYTASGAVKFQGKKRVAYRPGPIGEKEFTFSVYDVTENEGVLAEDTDKDGVIDTLTDAQKNSLKQALTKEETPVKGWSALAPSGLIDFDLIDFSEEDLSDAEERETETADGQKVYARTKTFTYLILEDIPEENERIPGIVYDERGFLASVTVTDNGTGGIAQEADPVYPAGGIVFKNSFEADTSAAILLTKGATRGDPAKNGWEFSFSLKQGEKTLQTVKNNGNDILFGKLPGSDGEPAADEKLILSYDETDIGKRYLYTVEEIGEANGFKKDTSLYRVQVDVSCEHNRLTARPQLLLYSYENPDLSREVLEQEDGSFLLRIGEGNVKAFTNTYLSSGTVTVSIDELLTGFRSKEIGQDEVTFTVTQADENGEKIEDGFFAETGTLASKEMDEKGIRHADTEDVVIPFTEENLAPLGETAVSYYLIEKAADLEGEEKKAGEEEQRYLLTVNARDEELDHRMELTVSLTDQNGKEVSAETQGQGTGSVVINGPSFTDHYQAKGELNVSAKVTLKGQKLSKGQFSFLLKDQKGNVLSVGENDKQGNIRFSIPYTQEEIGKTSAYTVEQKNEGLGGISYDDAVYTVSASVRDAEESNGTLLVTDSVSKNGKPLKKKESILFNNTYTASGTLVLNGRKILDGNRAEGIKEEEFQFLVKEKLKTKNGKTKKRLVSHGKTEKGGKIVFDAIVYSEGDAGEHTYEISEYHPKKNEAGYDETVYYTDAVFTIKADVTDNRDGTMTVKADYPGNETEVEFTNLYLGEAEEPGTEKPSETEPETEPGTETESETESESETEVPVQTGDETPLALHFSLLLISAILILLISGEAAFKKRTGRKSG